MSRRLSPEDHDSDEYALDAKVSFLHAGRRLYGTVVRVYNSRDLYHVLADGLRYEVHLRDDEMRSAS